MYVGASPNQSGAPSQTAKRAMGSVSRRAVLYVTSGVTRGGRLFLQLCPRGNHLTGTSSIKRVVMCANLLMGNSPYLLLVVIETCDKPVKNPDAEQGLKILGVGAGPGKCGGTEVPSSQALVYRPCHDTGILRATSASYWRRP